MVIFHPILTVILKNCLLFRDKSNDEKFKALSPCVMILIFGPIFAPRPRMGNIVHKDPKPP